MCTDGGPPGEGLWNTRFIGMSIKHVKHNVWRTEELLWFICHLYSRAHVNHHPVKSKGTVSFMCSCHAILCTTAPLGPQKGPCGPTLSAFRLNSLQWHICWRIRRLPGIDTVNQLFFSFSSGDFNQLEVNNGNLIFWEVCCELFTHS